MPTPTEGIVIEYGETDMTASALVQRAVRSPHGWRGNQPRWKAVSDIFKLGMTSSLSICKAAGFEPFETLRQFNKSSK